MTRQITRRRLITAGMGAVALGALPGVHAIYSAVAAETKVRIATALRAAFQSLGWIGAEAGMFRRHGIEVTFPSLEAGVSEAVTRMLGGEWDFAHTDDVPIVQEVLQGHDPVLILAPTDLHEGIFVMARRDITKPEQLARKRIGVVDQTGQLGRAMQLLLQKWGVSATLISLGSFQAIYAALGKGDLDAGYLPIDLRFRGQNEFGWTALESLPAGTGGIVTTRRFVAANRDVVAGIVKGFVDTIHLFKTRRDTVVPLLQSFLQFTDRKVVEELHAFYTPVFRAVPRPPLSQGLYDASFVDELDQSGYIQRLYAGDTKN